MKNQIVVISFLLIGFLSLSQAFGQQPSQEERKAFKEAKKALHEESRAYVEENILPVMQAQRAKLDLILSAAEQQELDAIRAELKNQREEKHEQKKAFHQKKGTERPQQRPEPTEEQIEQMRAQQKAHRQLMTRAWAIADAHESSIYKLLDEVADDRKSWKEDLDQIRTENLADIRKEKEGDRPIKRQERGMEGKGGKGHPHMHKGPQHGPQGGGTMGHLRKVTSEPVAFLLWDGSLPERPERQQLDDEQELTVFPNPSSNSNQLRYTVEKTGQVTVSLLNSEGITLKTLSSKTQKAGDYTETFSLEGLEAGTYYYKVELPTGRQVKRFVIK